MLMGWRILVVALAAVGLYFALWHSGVPLNHFEVFGRGFGGQHTAHSVLGLVLLGAALWLYMRYWKKKAAA